MNSYKNKIIAVIAIFTFIFTSISPALATQLATKHARNMRPVEADEASNVTASLGNALNAPTAVHKKSTAGAIGFLTEQRLYRLTEGGLDSNNIHIFDNLPQEKITKIINDLQNLRSIYKTKGLPYGYLNMTIRRIAYANTIEKFELGILGAYSLAEAGLGSYHFNTYPETPEQLQTFQANIDKLKRLSVNLLENGITPYYTLVRCINLLIHIPSEKLQQYMTLANYLAIKGIDPKYTLDEGIFAIEKALKNPTELQMAMTLANLLAEKGINPYFTLKYGIPAIKNHRTPEEFLQAMALTYHLAEKGIDPTDTLQTIAAPGSPEEFQQKIALANRLAEKRIDPENSIGIVINIAKTSRTPEEFKQIMSLVDFLIENGINPGIVLRNCIPAIINNSNAPEKFKIYIKALEELANRLIEKGMDPTETLSYGFPLIIEISKTSEEFRIGIDLLFKMGDSWLNWHKITTGQTKQLIDQIIKSGLQQIGYRIAIMPEKGHYKKVAYIGNTVDSYGNLRSFSSTSNIYEIDSLQTIELIPDGEKTSSLKIESLTLNDKFLRSRKVLKVAAKTYWMETLGKDYTSLAHIAYNPFVVSEDWFKENSVGKGAAFIPKNIITGYYPLVALGQDVVIHVYETDREKTIMPVNTVLLRGKINRRLRYEIIPKLDFETLLTTDELTNWRIANHITTEPIKKIVSQEDTLTQLSNRNWIWHSLKNIRTEITSDEVLDNIRNLKTKIPALLETMKKLKIQKPVCIYALGSSIWGNEPGDLDLIVVTEENRSFEILDVSQVKNFNLPINVRVVGFNALNQATRGKMVENYQRLRIEAMIMYGSAVLIAGQDIFINSKMPVENLSKLIDHFYATTEQLQTVPSLTDEERRIKTQRWTKEIAAMEQFAIDSSANSTGNQAKLDEYTRILTTPYYLSYPNQKSIREIIKYTIKGLTLGQLTQIERADNKDPEQSIALDPAKPKVVVLAGGAATRLVFPDGHPNQGRAKVNLLLDRGDGSTIEISQLLNNAIQKAGMEPVIVLPGNPKLNPVVRESFPGAASVTQQFPLGTGHAAMQAERLLRNYVGVVTVLSSDMPLVTSNMLTDLSVKCQQDENVVASVLAGTLDNPLNPVNYGKVVIDEATGTCLAIIEQKDVDKMIEKGGGQITKADDNKTVIARIYPTDKTKEDLLVLGSAIQLPNGRIVTAEEMDRSPYWNSSIYAARSPQLWDLLDGTNTENAQREFYLTDIVTEALKADMAVTVSICNVKDSEYLIGINYPAQVDECSALLQERIAKEKTATMQTTTADAKGAGTTTVPDIAMTATSATPTTIAPTEIKTLKPAALIIGPQVTIEQLTSTPGFETIADNITIFTAANLEEAEARKAELENEFMILRVFDCIGSTIDMSLEIKAIMGDVEIVKTDDPRKILEVLQSA